jgi:hypothetical protein
MERNWSAIGAGYPWGMGYRGHLESVDVWLAWEFIGRGRGPAIFSISFSWRRLETMTGPVYESKRRTTPTTLMRPHSRGDCLLGLPALLRALYHFPFGLAFGTTDILTRRRLGDLALLGCMASMAMDRKTLFGGGNAETRAICLRPRVMVPELQGRLGSLQDTLDMVSRLARLFLGRRVL